MKILLFVISSLILFFWLVLPNQTQAIDSVGSIEPPPGTEVYINASGVSDEEVAIIFFVSRMIKLVMIIAAVWAVIMILLSGYTFITSMGDSAAYQKVRSQLTNAIIGLLLIILAYTVTGLISLILFGDAGFILNPTLEIP